MLLCSHHLLTSHFIFKPQLAKCYGVFIRFLSKRTSFLEKTASHLQQTIKTFTSFETHLPEKPPDVPCSLVKNGYLFCGDFSNCPKVFPFQKTAPPKPLVVVAQADPAGRLLVTSNVWGMKKRLHGFESVGSRLFLHELDTNKWGHKTTWCSLIQK